MRSFLLLAVFLAASAVAPCLSQDSPGDKEQDDRDEETDQDDRYGGRRPGRPGIPGRPGPPGRPADAGTGDAISFPYAGARLRVLAGWKQLDFEFPDDATRRAMVDGGQFVPVNNMIIDVDVYDKGGKRMVFVTSPRTRPGVPVTLSTLSDRRDADGQPLLKPFPDWKTNNGFFSNDCDNSLTSVFRVFVDSCGRLWVLDCGVINANNGNPSMPCGPKIVVYDLENDNRLIGSFPVPRELLEANSMLITIAVETSRRDCADAVAYVADSLGAKLLVFELASRAFWRANSVLLAPFPDQVTFNVSGVEFDVPGGVFGLALGPKLGGGRRRLYFHGIASVRQSWVETAALRNRSLWADNMNAAPREFRLLPGARPSQSVVSAMTGRGLLVFALTQSNEIACWDSQRPFGGRNIVRLLKDDEKLQFNVGIKVAKGRIYLATNRIQNFVRSRVPTDEVNYRVMEADLLRLTEGTACAPSASSDRFDDYAPFSEEAPAEEAPAQGTPAPPQPGRPTASV